MNFQPTNFNPSSFASPDDFSLIPIGDNLMLRFTPVPEPAFVMAICLGGAAGYGVLRRRRVRRRATRAGAGLTGRGSGGATPHGAVPS